MNNINLFSLITLGAVLAVGLTVIHFLRRYLRDIDGAVGITSQEAMEHEGNDIDE